MFKFAFLAGIAAEWLLGPTVDSVFGFGFAALRATMAMLLAWMVLEGLALLVRGALSYDDHA
jgi:hypothetical protein